MNEKYHTKLQEELVAYPYKRDYAFCVDNINIDIPMIYGDASSIMYFMPIKISKALEFIHDKRIKPVSIFPGITLVAINIFEYRKSVVGPFNEFTFSIPVIINRKINIPILPLLFDQQFKKLGFYVIQLGASNDLGRRHIENIWGYPTYNKNIDIDIKNNEKCIVSTIKENNESILEISEDLPQSNKFKFEKKRFNTYFMHNGKLCNVKLETFLFGKTWVKSKNFNIQIGDHILGRMLKKLEVKNKFATTFYPNAIEIASKVSIL